jgi:Transcriptional regulator
MESNNRENILHIALDLFAIQGYEATGIQEIVDKAEISKPTLYHYFGNKRGLLDAVIGEYGCRMFAVIENGTRYNHDLVMNLTILTREMINHALSNQAFFRLYVALCSTGPGSQGFAASQPLRDSVYSRLESMFASAAQDHGNMVGREKAYSRTFMGVISAWALLVINREIELNDQTLYAIVHQFMHGIYS